MSINEYDLAPCERIVRTRELIAAILACEWEDAEVVMSAFLQEYQAGSPPFPFMEPDDDAEFWASIATYDELRAYFIACGRRLVERQMGLRGKVRLIERVLSSVPDEQRDKAMNHLVAQHRAAKPEMPSS